MGDYAKAPSADLAGRIDPFTYQDCVLADAQIKGQIKPVERSASEQAMRFECLKIAAGMSGNSNVQLLMMTAESLLKWVRGN